MDERYNQKYRIPSARLKGWDYNAHGLYFITICTKDKAPYFGNIGKGENDEPISTLTEIGNIASENWLKIPEHYSYVNVDEFVIMPNHIHGILFINNPQKESWELNRFGPQSGNLASIIRGYKASVKKYATLNDICMEWQPRYHDRIIRSEHEYNNIRQYIYQNPQNWLSDPDHQEGYIW